MRHPLNALLPAVAALTLLTILLLGTTAAATDELQYPRHSPDVVLKVGAGKDVTELLKDLLKSVPTDPLLGTGGEVSKPVISQEEAISALSDPSLSTSMTDEDLMKLKELTGGGGTASAGGMPQDLRYDLSMASGLVKDEALKEVLKGWAERGTIDLSELREKVDLASLSKEDLAVLKSILGLASKYGLVSKDELASLGLEGLSTEDLKALAEVLSRAATLSKYPSTSLALKDLAERLSLAGSLGNASLLSSILKYTAGSRSLPHIAKALTEGLASLGGITREGIASAPQAGAPSTQQPAPPPSEVPKPELPKIPTVTVPKPPKVSLPTAPSWALWAILASVASVIAAYFLLKYLGVRALVAGLRARIEGGVRKYLLSAEGINASIIRRYWEAVAYLSRYVPRREFETHREYLAKALKYGGEAFKELTKLYEVARWSGRSLSSEDLRVAEELLSKIRGALKSAGV